MSEDIVLSVCIPTFNRSSFLKEAIESVLIQINETSRDKVELVISDNASDDNTFEAIEEVKKRSSIPLVYHRNEQNKGYDANCLNVVELAHGKYCWLLGDDDQLALGAIGRILREIAENPEVDVFFCNREEYDSTFSHLLRFLPEVAISQDCIFDFRKVPEEKYLKLVRNSVGLFGYISLLVFRREKWLGAVSKRKFIGTGYVHVYPFMYMLWGFEKGVLKYLRQKMVKTRLDNERFPLERGFFNRVRMEVEHYHSIARDVLRDSKLVRLVDNLILSSDGFSWVVRARIGGGSEFYKKIVPLLFKYYWGYPRFWLQIFPVFIIPPAILKFMRRVYRTSLKPYMVKRNEP